MKRHLLFLLFTCFITNVSKSQLYFPPNNSSAWDTLSPTNLGWCSSQIDSLYSYLAANNTKAFILLKDGKIVLEKYFNGHTDTSKWYWASAAKTLTAFLIGLAQEDSVLSIYDSTSKFLDTGWTSCPLVQEQNIKIWHQLTMTSGLDDGVADPYCTIDTCLQCLANAGARWAYHNGPYTLLDSVLRNATGMPLNVYATQRLRIPTGMDGFFIRQGYNNVFFSTARSMARFGLLVLNRGYWGQQPIMADSNYFNQMVQTSQTLNESYGYLWWLNGKNSYRLPQTQIVFPGWLNTNAPADMIAALGKNGQFINIVPSQNLVWIRMGDAPNNSLVPFTLNNDIWGYIDSLDCPLGFSTVETATGFFELAPNPAKETINLKWPLNQNQDARYTIIDCVGRIVKTGNLVGSNAAIGLNGLPFGIYQIMVYTNSGRLSARFSKY